MTEEEIEAKARARDKVDARLNAILIATVVVMIVAMAGLPFLMVAIKGLIGQN